MTKELLLAVGIPAAYLLISTALLLSRDKTLPPFLLRLSARRAIAWNTQWWDFLLLLEHCGGRRVGKSFSVQHPEPPWSVTVIPLLGNRICDHCACSWSLPTR